MPANVKLTIPSYTGNTPDPAFFKAGVDWDACTGLGSVDGAKLLDGIASLLYNSTFYFQVNKGSYGLDEVKGNLSYSNPTPMWLVLEGFTPNAVTAAGVTPSVISSVTGNTVAVQTAQPELPSQPNTPQRIFYPCTVQFMAKTAQSQSQGGVFRNSQNPPVSLGALLVAPSISVGGQLLPAAETTLILDQGADPYFANYANNGYFYLSQDLRLFTGCPGIPAQSAPIDGIPLSASDPHNWDTGAAYSYIQALPTHLNSTYADPTSNAFAQFPDQSNALSGDSSVTPSRLDPANPSVNTPFANYNFAVARVRVNGTANTTTTSNVRVLFRLFATQTSDTDYNTLTYASTLDADQQPLAPTLGSGDVTIPFFATGNYEANSDFGVNTDYSGTSSINNQPVTIGGSGKSFAYYGCYLNIYPTGNTVTTSAGKQAVQALLPSTHSCVVAQLVYDEAPYPTGSGVVLGPEWSRELRPAQPPDHLFRQSRAGRQAPRPADLRRPPVAGAGQRRAGKLSRRTDDRLGQHAARFTGEHLLARRRLIGRVGSRRQILFDPSAFSVRCAHHRLYGSARNYVRPDPRRWQRKLCRPVQCPAADRRQCRPSLHNSRPPHLDASRRASAPTAAAPATNSGTDPAN